MPSHSDPVKINRRTKKIICLSVFFSSVQIQLCTHKHGALCYEVNRSSKERGSTLQPSKVQNSDRLTTLALFPSCLLHGLNLSEF